MYYFRRCFLLEETVSHPCDRATDARGHDGPHDGFGRGDHAGPPSEVQSQAQEILNQAIADGKVSENAKLDLAFQVYNLDYQQGDATIADATKATGIWRYIVQSVTAEDMNAVIYVAEGGGDVAPFEAFSSPAGGDNGRAPSST